MTPERHGDAADAAREQPARAAADAERGIVRAGQPAADAAAPTPERVLAATRLVRDGAHVPPRARALPADAAVAGPSGVRGPLLPHAAGHPGRGRPAVGRAERRVPRLHERARDGDDALRCAHRRARAHDGRGRRPLARRDGTGRPGRLRPAHGRRHGDPAAVAARRAVRRARPPRRGGPAGGRRGVRRRAARHRGGDRGGGGGGRRRARPDGLPVGLAGSRTPRRAPGRRVPTSPPPDCSRSAASPPPARTRRPTRSSLRPTAGDRPTRSPSIRCC